MKGCCKKLLRNSENNQEESRIGFEVLKSGCVKVFIDLPDGSRHWVEGRLGVIEYPSKRNATRVVKRVLAKKVEKDCEGLN